MHTLILDKRRRGCMGWESMRGTVREGERGEGAGRVGEREEKQQNDILLKQMGHRYKENGKEEEGTGGRNKKKRLVMSMLSVTSFVDSHQVSMTTVKSLWESDTRHWSCTCSNLFIDLIWRGRCQTDVIYSSHWHWFVSEGNIHATDSNWASVLQWEIIILSRYVHMGAAWHGGNEVSSSF